MEENVEHVRLSDLSGFSLGVSLSREGDPEMTLHHRCGFEVDIFPWPFLADIVVEHVLSHREAGCHER